MTDVTVLMTVYNGMPYLPAAVQSVMDQTLHDFRFVIVDDGSGDGTADYLAGLRDSRIEVICQENRGTAAAANRGLQNCTTQFVARMDADDVSLPNRLAAQLAFLKARPEVGLAGTQIAPLGDASVGASLALPTDHQTIFDGLLAGRHALAHSSIMFRTRLLKELGGYWSFPLVDDWDMMLRMGEAARLANLDTVLHHYRVHAHSLNGASMGHLRFSYEFACRRAHRRHAGLPEPSLEQFKAEWNARPRWRQTLEAIDLHARCQYRRALGEIYGRRRWRGRARLAWAALCAPHLTCQRVLRTVS